MAPWATAIDRSATLSPLNHVTGRAHAALSPSGRRSAKSTLRNAGRDDLDLFCHMMKATCRAPAQQCGKWGSSSCATLGLWDLRATNCAIATLLNVCTSPKKLSSAPACLGFQENDKLGRDDSGHCLTKVPCPAFHKCARAFPRGPLLTGAAQAV